MECYGLAMLHTCVLYILAKSICGAAHWSTLCMERGVLDCNDLHTSGTLRADDSLRNASLVIKNCVFLNCPPIDIRAGSAAFTNVTFRNSSSHSSLPGGAVQISEGSKVTFSYCSFVSCNSATSGGAVAVLESTVTASECIFYNCTARNGGSVLIFRSTATLASCRFKNSYATSQGGAIHIDRNSSLKLAACSFEGSRADLEGGALAVTGGSAVNASSCWFDHSSVQANGGVVYLSDASTVQCSDSMFSNSHALKEGGIFYLGQNKSHLALFRCNIINASAVDMGGALSVHNSRLLLDSCIFHNTMSELFGSLMASRNAQVEIRNVSVNMMFATIHGVNYRNVAGCLYVELDSNVAIYNSNFYNCTTGRDGGFAFLTSGSRLLVSKSTILADAPFGCGALAAVEGNSQLTLRAVVSSSSQTAAKSGGCVCISGNGSVICGRDSLILRCSTVNSGGAFYLQDKGILMLNGCTVRYSRAQDNGGGIAAIDDGRVILGGINQIVDNAAYLYGGAIFLGGKAHLSLRDGMTDIGQNVAGQCGGAVTLEGGNVTLEQLYGLLTAYNNTGVGSLMCLTGSLPKILFSTVFQNSLGGTIWVENAATASQILKMEGSRLVANLTHLGPAVTLRISDGLPRVITINVSQPLPSFSVSAVDAFGNVVHQPLHLQLNSFASGTNGCNELANLSKHFNIASNNKTVVVLFPEIFLNSRPGLYCFEIQSAAGTLPNHHDDFPWPLIQVQVLPCNKDTEVFDEATLQCVAATEEIHSDRNTFLLHVVVGCLAAVVALLAAAALIFYRRRLRRRRSEIFAFLNLMLAASDDRPSEITELIDDETLLHAYDRACFEINRSRLQFSEKLGEGTFGIVLRGRFTVYDNEETEVAVKLPRCFGVAEHYEALIKELQLMAHAHCHPNVVELYGAITKNLPNGELFVVMELCKCRLTQFLHGDVKIEGVVSPPTLSLSLRIGCGVAAGMEHLGSKQIVHQDLAARNILLDANASPKITDYGLLQRSKRSPYESKKPEVGLPWRWTAPELLDCAYSKDIRFTIQSDIWSYGVLLWEVFSFGDDPYKDISGMSQLREYLKNGGRLQRPEHCPRNVFAHIEQCWHADPSQRPSFSRCGAFLREFLLKFEELEH